MLDFLPLILVVFTVGLNSFLALLVFKNNPKSATNLIFALLGSVISIWLIVMYISFQPLAESILWIRLSLFLATPMSTLFFLLAHTLPMEKLRLSSFRLAIIALANTTVMAVTASPFAFTDVVITNNTPTPVPGAGIAVFGFYVLFCSLSSVYVLFRRFRIAKGVQKEQFKLIMIGILLMYGLLIATVLLPVALFQYNKFVTYAPMYTLIFLAATAYAIIRHRFLDIRLLVARTVSFTLLTGVFGLFYAFIYSILSAAFLTELSLQVVIISTLLALTMAFTFQPLRRAFEILSDRFFYQDLYDAKQLLYRLTLIMASTFELKSLLDQILKELLSQIRLKNGAFVLIEKDQVYESASMGYKEPLNISNQEVFQLILSGSFFIYDELPDGMLKDILRKSEFQAVAVLVTESTHIGLLGLGEKLSGDVYSQDDFKTLQILAPEISIAIQNAKAYEQIKKFNITLQDRVNQATHKLQEANKKLMELDKLKDDFLSIASHELRTPMTAIRSYVWMALYRPDIKLSEKMTKYLTRILISTERLIVLVNDLLNISRIESGRIEFIPKVFNLIDLAKDAIEDISPKAKEKGVVINIKEQTKLAPVFADPDKVSQVLLNLLGNAVKFTAGKGQIAISFYSDNQFIEVSVTDNGVGIDPSDLSRLFQKFGRLDTSYVAAATSGGTGLGLYICKSLVEQMGGKIWAVSQGQGKGSTFTFSLPVASKENLAQSSRFTKKIEGEVKVLEPVAL